MFPAGGWVEHQIQGDTPVRGVAQWAQWAHTNFPRVSDQLSLHPYRCSSNWIGPHLILVEEFGKILKVRKNRQNHLFPTKALDGNDLHLDSSDDWIFFYVSVLQFLRGL